MMGCCVPLVIMKIAKRYGKLIYHLGREDDFLLTFFLPKNRLTNLYDTV